MTRSATSSKAFHGGLTAKQTARNISYFTAQTMVQIAMETGDLHALPFWQQVRDIMQGR